MKKRLDWFVVPCVATMFAGNAVNLHAQDTPKAKQRINVVINQSHEDEVKNIREKVSKELANSGVSEEIKARILKDIEEALNKVQKKLTVRSTKSADEAESAADAAKSRTKIAGQVEDALSAKEKALRMLNQVELLNPAKGFTTHFFVDPTNDSYRIGVQCIQSEVDEGDDANEGLEVKAVFDDSPARKAGIEEGDVLLTIDATKINKISDLTNALQEAGKKEKDVTIEAKRDEKVISLTVKPTKMKSSDIGLENIRLSLPTEGFVVNDEVMKTVQEQMKKLGSPDAASSSQVWSIKSESEEWKKDLAELKSEMAELKKMIKELAGKKSE
ncbi:MAG: PDZ domain-containing protein [Planctomycetota bacterium]|nr:PDZ domain-containing protein [Planctomycetota bacterium]